MENNKIKALEYVNDFVRRTYRRKLLRWVTNQTILMFSILLTFYLFWLIYNNLFLLTQLEWQIFPLSLLFSLAPFLFGKPNISSTIEFLEKRIKELKGRLYLAMEPYPSPLDSKVYKKRAIKECVSILKREKIKKLIPIKSNPKHFAFLGSIIFILIVFYIFFGGLKLKRITENPVIIYSDKKIEENQTALIIAKSTQLKQIYLFSNEGIKRMIELGNGKFGIMARIKKTSTVQVGYRTWKSKKVKLEVIPSLFISKLILKYRFPYYLETRSFSDTLYNCGEEILIQALTGTQIHFSGVSNLILGAIKGKIDNKAIKDRKFSGNFVLKEKKKISVNLTDTSLFSSYTLNFSLDPIKDEPPSVEFLSPPEEYKLVESMEVPVIIQVEDDYGLSSTSLLYGKKEIELFVPANIKFLEDSLTLRIRNLLTGETLKLRGSATDLAGNKTLSHPILIYMPTLEELFSEYQAVSDTLESYTSDIEEKEKEITDKIEKFLYKSNLGQGTKYEIKKTLKEQKDLIEGIQKLAELTEEVRNPEISREIDHIKELIDNPQVEDFLANLNKTIENPNISLEDLRNLNADQQNLMRTLELFKRSLEYLKKLLELNEFSIRAEEIYKEQKEITSSKPDESVSKLEEELSEELERLIQDMEKSIEGEIKNIASEFEMTNTIKEMEKLAHNMKKGEMNEKTVKRIEENLRNLNISLKNARENRVGEQITEALKEKGWELGFILRTHDNLTDMKPCLEKGLVEQGLCDALDKVEKELQGLFIRSLAFSPEVFNYISRAKEKLKALSLELTEREVPKSSMERVNDLLMQAILKLFSAPPPSSQDLASALRQIIEQQNLLLNGLGKTMPIPLPELEADGKLKILSEKQRQLAEDLRRIGKAFGPLSSEMEKMADDLERGILDRKLIERQRKVLDRLLEAESALREGGTSRKRRSEPGIFVSPEKVSLPKNLGEEKKKLRELLEKRMNEPYPEEYKKEVDEYFRRLIE
jgi:hypothetical protein